MSFKIDGPGFYLDNNKDKCYVAFRAPNNRWIGINKYSEPMSWYDNGNSPAHTEYDLSSKLPAECDSFEWVEPLSAFAVNDRVRLHYLPDIVLKISDIKPFVDGYQFYFYGRNHPVFISKDTLYKDITLLVGEYIPYTMETCPVGLPVRHITGEERLVVYPATELYAHIGISLSVEYQELVDFYVKFDGTPAGLLKA